jgi:predicted Zn-dependent peptidase
MTLLQSAGIAMRRALFGNGYGLDSLGTKETVSKFQASDLKSFHKKLTAPNNCVFAIYGDVKTTRSKPPLKRRS